MSLHVRQDANDTVPGRNEGICPAMNWCLCGCARPRAFHTCQPADLADQPTNDFVFGLHKSCKTSHAVLLGAAAAAAGCQL